MNFTNSFKLHLLVNFSFQNLIRTKQSGMQIDENSLVDIKMVVKIVYLEFVGSSNHFISWYTTFSNVIKRTLRINFPAAIPKKKF